MPERADADGLLASTASYTGALRGVITAAYFGCFFSIGVGLASLGPILPPLAHRLDEDIEGLGVLFVARALGYVGGSIIGGWVFDRVQRTHAPLVLGNVCCAIGYGVLPSLSSKAAVAIALASGGVCMGMLDTGGNVLLIWLQGKGRVEPYMQAMHFCFALGALLSPLLIEGAIRAASAHVPDDFSAAFYAISGSILCCSLPLAVTRGPQQPRARLASSSSSADCNERHAPPSVVNVQVVPSPAVLLVTTSAACLLLYVGAEVGFGGFIFTFAFDHLQVSATAARALNSVFWGGLAIGRLLAVPLSAHLPPHVLLYTSLIGCVCASTVMLWLKPSAVWAADGKCCGDGSCPPDGSNLTAARGCVPTSSEVSTLAWVSTAALGLSMASVFPSVITHAERSMDVTGRIASMFVVSAAVGESIIPMVIALAYPAKHTSFVWIIVVVCLAQFAAFIGARAASRAIAMRRGNAATATTTSNHTSDSSTTIGPSCSEQGRVADIEMVRAV